jgi:hypothetical protein
LCGSPAIRDLVSISRGQHTELVAVGIGHDHPADLALADVDASRPEGDETVDLRLLITVNGWSEVEMQPVLPGLRHQGRTAPGSSVISQSRTPLQKRARRSGSVALKQSARR